jgi:LysR family nitrogen assimilation transcriptional regulator
LIKHFFTIMTMDLRQIQYFISLYEEKSVTRAAKRLNIVQPALSMQIARLEQEVGRELFTRTPRGMDSTPVADQMYSLFLPVVTAFSAAKSKVVHDGKSLSGHVRIGLVPNIEYTALAAALTKFTALHPDVSLSITEGLTSSLCSSVSSGELDLAFINGPELHSTLTQVPVFKEEVVVVTGHNHPLEHDTIVQAEQLLQYKLILPTRNHGIRQVLEDYARSKGVTFLPALEIDSILARAELIDQGPYLGFLPESIAVSLIKHTYPKLRVHRLAGPRPKRELVYAYDPKKAPSAAAEVFALTLAAASREHLSEGLEIIRSEQGPGHDPTKHLAA